MHVSKKEFQFSIDNKNRSMVDKKKKSIDTTLIERFH